MLSIHVTNNYWTFWPPVWIKIISKDLRKLYPMLVIDKPSLLNYHLFVSYKTNNLFEHYMLKLKAKLQYEGLRLVPPPNGFSFFLVYLLLLIVSVVNFLTIFVIFNQYFIISISTWLIKVTFYFLPSFTALASVLRTYFFIIIKILFL